MDPFFLDVLWRGAAFENYTLRLGPKIFGLSVKSNWISAAQHTASLLGTLQQGNRTFTTTSLLRFLVGLTTNLSV